MLSVLLCTHDPRPDDFRRTLDALRAQTLRRDLWELLLIDNAAPAPLESQKCVGWHPQGRLVREERLGLTRARLRGIAEARGELLVFCDDDNLLAPDYLALAAALFASRPGLGAAGGHVRPEYAEPPPAGFAPFAGMLAVRDLGDKPLTASWADGRRYPDFAPVGAGLVIRSEIARAFAADTGLHALITDRVGRELSSGGDNALVLAALEAGAEVGYFPELKLTHLIPAARLRPAYLQRLNRASSESWVRLLASKGLSPWTPVARWTLPLRMARAFLAHRAWRGPAGSIRWAGACGILAGRAPMPRASIARPRAKLTAGRVVYLACHRPLAEIRRSIRQGGPWNQWLDARGARALRRAAWPLPPAQFGFAPALELHVLTGRAFAEQSLFCLWSFAQAARRNVAPVFHDDGTLTPGLADRLRLVFPRARFLFHQEMTARLDSFLPASRFPVLRERFAHFPLLRKLVNPHLGSSGWKLLLDSDLLFFRRPDFLLDWLANPRRPLHAVDVAEAYGYPRALLERLAGAPLAERLNTGLCGLRSESIDWEKLESWAGQLIAAHGTHYFLEQSLTAMLLAGQDCAVAPAADYLIMPGRDEAEHPRAVMHHYVHDSKRWYFRAAWKHVLADPARLKKESFLEKTLITSE